MPKSLATQGFLAFLPRLNFCHEERINAPMQGSVWTEEQERVLIAMFHHGEPVAKIAEKLQRTTGGIAAKLHKLGLIENRKDIK